MEQIGGGAAVLVQKMLGKGRKHKGHEESVLEAMSGEILVHIFSFLDPASLASLALGALSPACREIIK